MQEEIIIQNDRPLFLAIAGMESLCNTSLEVIVLIFPFFLFINE